MCQASSIRIDVTLIFLMLLLFGNTQLFAGTSSIEGGDEANLDLYVKSSATTATQAMQLKANNTAGAETIYGKVQGKIDDATSSTEDGAIQLYAMVNGMLTPIVDVNGNGLIIRQGNFVVNSDKLYVDGSTGNVGIGTASPGFKLHTYVDNTTDRQINIEQDGSGGAGISFARTGIWGWTVGVDGDSDFKIEDSTNLGVNNDFVIDGSTANIGFGVTNPKSPLQIVNNVVSGFSNFNDYQILLYDTGTASSSYGIGIENSTMKFNSNFNYNFYQNNAKVFTINTDKVGIGSAAPATALDVDSNSNSQNLRLRGAAESAEIGEVYMGSGGELVLSTVTGTDSAAYIEMRPEDNEYGMILRESDGTGTTPYANFYVYDPTNGTSDYLTIGVNATTNNSALTITASNLVGIGADAHEPEHYHADVNNLVVKDSSHAGITIASASTTANVAIAFADGTANDYQTGAGGIQYKHQYNSLNFWANNSPGVSPFPLVTLNPDGSLYIGVKNGTVATPWLGGSIYCEQEGSVYALKTKGSDGFGQTITPHNFSYFTPAADDLLPWSHFSQNTFIGKAVNVDMSGALQALETLTGRQFVYYGDLPAEEVTDYAEWKTSTTIELTQRAKEEELRKNPMIEITLQESLETIPEIEQIQVAVINTKYRINYTTQQIEQYQVEEFEIREQQTGNTVTRLKGNCQFDETTGKIYRHRTMDDVVLRPEILTQIAAYDLPKYIKDRIPYRPE